MVVVKIIQAAAAEQEEVLVVSMVPMQVVVVLEQAAAVVVELVERMEEMVQQELPVRSAQLVLQVLIQQVFGCPAHKQEQGVMEQEVKVVAAAAAAADRVVLSVLTDVVQAAAAAAAAVKVVPVEPVALAVVHPMAFIFSIMLPEVILYKGELLQVPQVSAVLVVQAEPAVLVVPVVLVALTVVER
jgi:hypothetical protein